MNVDELCRVVCDYYRRNARAMPWREPDVDGHFNSYQILVSELMLQQTQVSRVIPKFTAFIERFPTVNSLAEAPLREVLQLWSGLGYNRRARFLHESAKKIRDDYSSVIPSSQSELESLPGIGPSTAAAIRAYAFNEPVVFIETNIRTVFLHHLFADEKEVSDTRVLPLVESALTSKANTLSPREWYWALMDYGVYLKATTINPSRRSKHHIVQSRFKGSRREVRGAVLKLLAQRPHTHSELAQQVPTSDYLDSVLESLVRESLITQDGSLYHLGDGIL